MGRSGPATLGFLSFRSRFEVRGGAPMRRRRASAVSDPAPRSTFATTQSAVNTDGITEKKRKWFPANFVRGGPCISGVTLFFSLSLYLQRPARNPGPPSAVEDYCSILMFGVADGR